MLSRQHYVALAEILRKNKNYESVRDALTEYLQMDNPRFDRERFLSVCK